MSKICVVVVGFLVALALQSAECKNWALLVAGSRSYSNYRHQADICHAYHILRNHGIPAENIVTMMYDDIANNIMNPFPGNIINQPDGPNVYPGVVIDYKEEDVNPEVFLAVLSGKEKKVKELTGHTGKVIKSGPEDHVFVNFVDHGAPGLIAFPRKFLHARLLEATYTTMHKNKQYKKLVFYVETCESGSMFKNLLKKDMNIYAATAANYKQSSYAIYFDKIRKTYLGDVFSVKWMQDSDKKDLKTETLQKQFEIAKRETNTSTVMEFGDMDITRLAVAEFQGNKTSNVSVPDSPRHSNADAVRAPEVQLVVLKYKLKMAKSLAERRKAALAISDLLNHNDEVDALFRGIVGRLSEIVEQEGKMDGVVHFRRELSYDGLVQERRDITRWDCYEQAVEQLDSACQGLKLSQDYHALQQLHVLVNLCERGFDEKDVRSATMQTTVDHHSLCTAA